MKIKNNKDNLFARTTDQIQKFTFDENVAEVFDDMISRSVPGYRSVVDMIGLLAGEYAQPNSSCYDLGASLGAVTLSMQKSITADNVQIIAVDNSQAMISKCKENMTLVKGKCDVDVVCDDIENIEFKDGSVVVLNFTLQFIAPEKREELIQRIYKGMIPGGILIISDKIAFEDKEEEARQIELHHAFKQANGYSSLEISQKEARLKMY